MNALIYMPVYFSVPKHSRVKKLTVGTPTKPRAVIRDGFKTCHCLIFMRYVARRVLEFSPFVSQKWRQRKWGWIPLTSRTCIAGAKLSVDQQLKADVLRRPRPCRRLPLNSPSTDTWSFRAVSCLLQFLNILISRCLLILLSSITDKFYIVKLFFTSLFQPFSRVFWQYIKKKR